MKDKVSFVIEKCEEKNSSGKAVGIIKVKWDYGYVLEIEDKPKYFPLKFSTGIKINVERWDKTIQRITSGNDKIKLNSILNRTEHDVLISYNHFIAQGINPSPEQIRKQMNTLKTGVNKPKQSIEMKTSIQDFMENHIMKNRIKKNTLKGHITTINKLDEYRKTTKNTLYFETLNTEQLVEFFNWCQHKRTEDGIKVLAVNSIHRYKKDIRKFIRLAKNTGIKCEVSFADNSQLTIKEEDGDGIALTVDQIKEIANLDLKKKGREGLQLCKDLIIIGCMTGLRFSDWRRLNKVARVQLKSGKKINVVKIRSRKDDSFLELPVFDAMMEIYERYGNNFPKPNTNQKFNEGFKEIGKLLKWDETTSRRITRIEKDYQDLPLWSRLSSHVCRRTFCTNSYRAGISMSIIMDISGHDTEKNFLKYVKVRTQSVDTYYEQMEAVYNF